MCARIFSHPLFDIIRCMDGIAPYFLSEEQHISVQVLDGIARSFGQVVFCNNPFSGIIILIAMLLADWHAGLCALLCNIVVRDFEVHNCLHFFFRSQFLAFFVYECLSALIVHADKLSSGFVGR